MSSQILRDSSGRRIGDIQTSSDGKQILRDGSGRRLGEYDPKSNVTRDDSGRRVGTGNLLASLLR